MQSKYVFLIITLIALSLVGAFSYRPLILNLLMVDTHHYHHSDLLVILEGGSWLYTPTRERLDKTIELYAANSTAVLVCSHQRYKQDIVAFLVSNGVRPSNIVKNQHLYGETHGTYNNVLEIISVLKRYEQYNSIEIVTGPYHERRTQIIFSSLITQSGITRPIHVKF